MKVAVFGLGKLGSPLVAVLASRGFEVTGTDVNHKYVELLDRGQPPVTETGLADMLAQYGARITATTDPVEAAAEAEVIFVVVPTPSTTTGAFSCQYAVQASRPIGTAIAERDDFPLVVLVSTVMPGDTDGKFVPALEAHSGKKCGEDFGVCYNPEFIALGSVIQDMLSPDFVLIGESDPKSGEILEYIYDRLSRGALIRRMSFINAEVAKLALNGYVTTKISYANQLGELCEKLPGADAAVVCEAIGLDTRIGRKYLKPGAAYGGPCFPRDNVALQRAAAEARTNLPICEATEDVNHRQTRRLARLARQKLPAKGRVGVLGLSYKLDTSVTERSAGVELAKLLAAQGVPVTVYDPAADAVLGDEVHYAETLPECAGSCDVLVVTTPHPEFEQLGLLLGSLARPEVEVMDCWGIVDPSCVEPGRHTRLGFGGDNATI